jgi:hypothetical protein
MPDSWTVAAALVDVILTRRAITGLVKLKSGQILNKGIVTDAAPCSVLARPGYALPRRTAVLYGVRRASDNKIYSSSHVKLPTAQTELLRLAPKFTVPFVCCEDGVIGPP